MPLTGHKVAQLQVACRCVQIMHPVTATQLLPTECYATRHTVGNTTPQQAPPAAQVRQKELQRQNPFTSGWRPLVRSLTTSSMAPLTAPPHPPDDQSASSATAPPAAQSSHTWHDVLAGESALHGLLARNSQEEAPEASAASWLPSHLFPCAAHTGCCRCWLAVADAPSPQFP